VSQIEVRAFDKLQKAMKNMVVEAANRPASSRLGRRPDRSRLHSMKSRRFWRLFSFA